jgi:hypothetical protein
VEQEQEHAFQYLKKKSTSQPILQYPDFSKEFILTTDASNTGIGTVLSQGTVGKDLPVAYASRSLNKAEINYTTSETELLAIVWANKYFRPYLYGRKFKTVTDHKTLTWVINVKDPGSQLLRWRIQLEEFDYEIVYKKGSQNTNAVALSRTGSLSTESKNELEIDDSLKRKILYEFHDAPVGGHRGMNGTYRAIKSLHSWPNMRRDIEAYVKQCNSCQVNKTLKPKKRAPMELTSTADHPFDKCYLDIVGPLPLSAEGNKNILTFQDGLSKYVAATPIKQHDAQTIARTFVTQVVFKYGTPSVVQTDQGANFVSELFKHTCKPLRIKKLQSTAFHPESQGSLERSHRVLAEYLRHYVKDDQTDWDEWIPFATYAYNTSEHTATGHTPFELMFGRPSVLPPALRTEPTPQYVHEDYVAELEGCLQTAHQVAKGKLLRSKARGKDHYDKNAEEIKVEAGDKVLPLDETVRRGRSRKLSSQCIGPYTVVEVDKVNVTISQGRKLLKVHVNFLLTQAKQQTEERDKQRTLYNLLFQMGFCQIVLVLLTLLGATPPLTSHGLGYNVEKFDRFPGVYFEQLGETSLSNTEWKFVVHIPLAQLIDKITATDQYVFYINQLRSKIDIRNWTTCSHFDDLISSRLGQVRFSERLISEIVEPDNGHRRMKRGVLNFVGKVSKILFGTMDEDDTKYYNDHIEHFEQTSDSLTHLLRQQLTVVRATLRAVNETLLDVTYNEDRLRDGITRLQQYVNTMVTQSGNVSNLLSVKLVVQEHIARALDTANVVQRNLDLVVDSTGKAQKGILQPQIVTPGLPLDALTRSIPSFPRDTTPPIPLSKNSIHLFCHICDVHVFMRAGMLSYVLVLPLVNKGVFDVLNVIPVPVVAGNKTLVYIDVEKGILCLDRARQFYFMTDEFEWRLCETVGKKTHMCVNRNIHIFLVTC